MSNDSTKIYEPVELYYTAYASPEAESSNLTPIIFLHGIISTNRTWNAVRYKISERTKRKVYAIDMRNHGKSPRSNNITLKYHIADLEHFMVTQGIPRAALIAHSLGGKIALALALKNPKMVESLMINDIQIIDTERHARLFKDMILFVNFIMKTVKQLPSDMTEIEAKEKLIPIFEKVYPKSRSDQMVLPFEKGPSGKFVWECNVEVMFGPNAKLSDYTLDLSTGSTFDGKAIFIAAADSDVQMFDDKDTILKLFPNAELKTVKNVYHSYHIEFPKSFIDEAVNFLNE